MWSSRTTGEQRGAEGQRGAERGREGQRGVERGRGAERGEKGQEGARRGEKGQEGARRARRGKKGPSATEGARGGAHAARKARSVWSLSLCTTNGMMCRLESRRVGTNERAVTARRMVFTREKTSTISVGGFATRAGKPPASPPHDQMSLAARTCVVPPACVYVTVRGATADEPEWSIRTTSAPRTTAKRGSRPIRTRSSW